MSCNCSSKSIDLAPLMDILSPYKQNPKGALIPVLQHAQDVYGYLPQEVLEVIDGDASARAGSCHVGEVGLGNMELIHTRANAGGKVVSTTHTEGYG